MATLVNISKNSRRSLPNEYGIISNLVVHESSIIENVGNLSEAITETLKIKVKEELCPNNLAGKIYS